MAVVDLFGAVGGRPEIDPSAASRGYELGTKAGAMSGQTGRLAFLNEMINKRDQRRATEASMAQEQTKARAAKIQDILIRGADPNANPVDRAAAEKVKVMLESNPQMAQVLGIDPDKTGSTTSSLDYIKALTNASGGEGFAPGTKANVKTPFGTMSIPMNRELTGTEANTISASKEIIKSAKDLKKNLGFLNEQNLIKGRGPFLKGKQDFDKTIEYILSTLLQIKSGAAVSDQEYDRWKKLLTPELSNAKEVDAKNIDRFINEFSNKIGGIMGGANFFNEDQSDSNEDVAEQVLKEFGV